jgi:hypothetical protein
MNMILFGPIIGALFRDSKAPFISLWIFSIYLVATCKPSGALWFGGKIYRENVTHHFAEIYKCKHKDYVSLFLVGW